MLFSTQKLQNGHCSLSSLVPAAFFSNSFGSKASRADILLLKPNLPVSVK